MPLARIARMHWAGTYDQALDYAAGTVVRQGGGLYCARLLRPHGAAAPADDAASWDTLVAAPVLRGPHDRSGAYAPRDVVTDAGGLYTCTALVVPDTRVDTFERPDQEGWGTASDGHVWAGVTGWNGQGPPSIVSSHGLYMGTDAGQLDGQFLVAGLSGDRDVLVHATITSDSVGGAYGFQVILCSDVNANNGALLDVQMDTTNGHLLIGFNVWNDSNGNFNWEGVDVGTLVTAGQAFVVRARKVGRSCSARIWAASAPEPTDWTIEQESTCDTAATLVGLGPRALSAGQTVTFDHFSATTLAPAPAADPEHWTALAPAPAQAGTPVLYGPYVVDYTDFAHSGDHKTLWVPAVGDVILRLVHDWQTFIGFDQGVLSVGQNPDDTVDPSTNVFGSQDWGGNDSTGFPSGNQLDPVVAGIAHNATGAQFNASAYVCHTTVPVSIQYAQFQGHLPTQGHIELYALVARAVAP